MTAFININDQIEQLQKIGETQGLTLYSIHFRKAGVGIMWFDVNRAGPPPIHPSMGEDKSTAQFTEEMKQYIFIQSQWTKKGLVVEKYYPSLSEALEGEKERIRWKYRPGSVFDRGPSDPSGIG